MLFIVGIIIVVSAVLGGYSMHNGDLKLLWQPSEFIIILGAAIGGFCISNPMNVVKSSIKALRFLFKGHPYSRADYTELILLFFNITKVMKVRGMLEIENHVEHPEESQIFSQAPSIVGHKINLEFIRDNLRLLVMGVDNPHQFEAMIDSEIEVLASELKAPGRAILSLGDSLPALGIIAAVLGVIVTMRSIVEPPEILGGLIAAALVGTFLGVLFSYGLFIPIGHFVSEYSELQILYLQSIKTGFIAYLNGNPPIVIAEFIRKTVPESVRPSFQDAEMAISNQVTPNTQKR
ncbi:MAG: flagellar motor stator protein MotA [Pseudomonadota bacterium]